jgi:hypothetical protein
MKILLIVGIVFLFFVGFSYQEQVSHAQKPATTTPSADLANVIRGNFSTYGYDQYGMISVFPLVNLVYQSDDTIQLDAQPTNLMALWKVVDIAKGKGYFVDEIIYYIDRYNTPVLGVMMSKET